MMDVDIALVLLVNMAAQAWLAYAIFRVVHRYADWLPPELAAGVRFAWDELWG